MGRLIKERLKTILILLLIVTGLLQVGILWSYQSQGTPTSFLLSFFNADSNISDEMAKEELFVPDRLILSNGSKSHWLLANTGEDYNSLWEEAKRGLKSISTGEIGLKVSDEKWGDVFEKRGFIIDFSYFMEPELFKWFMGSADKSEELPYISKIMVKPDIVDESISTYYILSKDNRVYVSDPVSRNNTKSISELLDATGEGKEQEYRNYHTFGGDNIAESMGAEPDVLYASTAPGTWPYPEYECKLSVKAEKRDELAQTILGYEKDRYNNSTYNGDTVQFNYGSNIYRYYSDGYLTYRYLGSADYSGKGKTGEALVNAYKFINRINKLSEAPADIILTAVEEEQQGVYRFSFDYKLGNMNVMVSYNNKDGKGNKINHAVNILADRKRVLSCDWLIREFEKGRVINYNDRFLNLDIVKQTGLVSDQMHIRDMRPGYFINSSSESVLKPMLLLYMKDYKSFQIEMKPQKGD